MNFARCLSVRSCPSWMAAARADSTSWQVTHVEVAACAQKSCRESGLSQDEGFTTTPSFKSSKRLLQQARHFFAVRGLVAGAAAVLVL